MQSAVVAAVACEGGLPRFGLEQQGRQDWHDFQTAQEPRAQVVDSSSNGATRRGRQLSCVLTCWKRRGFLLGRIEASGGGIDRLFEQEN